jgi:hypothetical protein
MPLRTVGRDAKTFGDLRVREALAHEFEHLILAGREDVGVPWPSAVCHAISLAEKGRIYTTRPLVRGDCELGDWGNKLP